MRNCLLCKVAREPSPLWKVHEDEHTIAVLETYPIHRGHVIVFTKEHYDNLMDMPLSEVAEFFKSVAIVAQAVNIATGAEGITLLQCNGECAWQNIPHVYAGIIPRFSGDRVRIDCPSLRASDEVQEEVKQQIVKEIGKIVPLEVNSKAL